MFSLMELLNEIIFNKFQALTGRTARKCVTGRIICAYGIFKVQESV